MFDAEFWVAISFVIFVGVLIYFRVQKLAVNVGKGHACVLAQTIRYSLTPRARVGKGHVKAVAESAQELTAPNFAI